MGQVMVETKSKSNLGRKGGFERAGGRGGIRALRKPENLGGCKIRVYLGERGRFCKAGGSSRETVGPRLLVP